MPVLMSFQVVTSKFFLDRCSIKATGRSAPIYWSSRAEVGPDGKVVRMIATHSFMNYLRAVGALNLPVAPIPSYSAAAGASFTGTGASLQK